MEIEDKCGGIKKSKMSILNKFRNKIREDFQIDEQLLNDFCEENQKYWEKQNGKLKDKYIIIGMFMVEKWIPWFESKLLYAKGVQERTGEKIVVFDWGYNEELSKLYQSYGIEFVSLKEKMFHNRMGCLSGLFRAVKVVLAGGNGTRLSDLKYKGCDVGHFMYDNTVRTIQDVYTIRNVRNKMCFKKVWTSYWLLSSLDKVYKKYPPAHYVFDDMVYDEGMIIEVLRNRNTKISSYTLQGQKLTPDLKNTIYWPDFEQQMFFEWLEQQTEDMKKNLLEEADKKLEERFRAQNGNVRDSKIAFLGKKEANREELGKVMGLHPDRKNVIICCHTLSESAHRCSEQVYEDTYSWIEETMKLVRNNPKVNWIVKVHPIGATKYGEVNVVESLFEKYQSDNLFLFPDEYNSALVGQLADGVITIYGTVGGEYSCFGIPVILAGKSAYSGQGYTVDAFTKEKYEKVLENITDYLEPLKEAQKEKAKLYFMYSLRKNQIIADEFGTELYNQWWDFDTALNSGKPVKEYNNRALNYLQQYMKKSDMRETACFIAGKEERS